MNDLAIETIRALLKLVPAAGGKGDPSEVKFARTLVETYDKTPQEGWLLLPKGGQCPRDLLVIAKVDGVDAVAAPLGGGFPIRLSLSRVLDDCQVMTGEAVNETSQWHAAWFGVDEYPRFRGYTLGLRWNGWAIPCFELKEAQRVARHFAPLGDRRDDHVLSVTQGGQAVTLYPNTPMRTLVPAHRIQTSDGRARVVYPVGARTWFWREYAARL